MAKKNGKTILVTGATGKQGGAVMRRLQEKNFTVRAMTRDPNKREARALVGHGAEVVRGDFNDPDSLTRAMDGVDGVYSVQNWTDGPEVEVRQGIALADAAKRSRISHFVYSSVYAADKSTGIPHFESKGRIEAHVRGTGLPYTILRPVFFMDNLLGMRESIEHGTLASPLRPGTRLQLIAVDDIGGVAAVAFERPGKWHNQIIELAGDELPMEAIARALGRVSGHEVRYRQIPMEQFEASAGSDLAKMFRWLEEKGYEADIGAARQIYPNLTSFERWLQTKWAKRVTA